MEKTKNEEVVRDNDVIDIRAGFSRILFHWPLYLLVTLLSLFAAYIYLRYTKPLYSSTAKIYIKDKNRGGNQSALDELNVFSANKVVENEMELVKSPLILENVIRDNKFNIRYYHKGKVLNIEYYENSPLELKVITDSSKVGTHKLSVEILNNSNIKISYPSANRESGFESFTTRFNQPFQIRKDQFAVTYHPQFNREGEKEFEIKVDSILPLVYKKTSELQPTLVNRLGSVFQISYEDEIPKRTADFLNALLTAYNTYTLDDKNQITLNTLRFIEGRLASLGEELNVLERNVEGFKKTRGITEIGESSKYILDQAREADRRLSQSEIQLSVFNEIDQYINNPKRNTPFAPVYGNIDPALNSLISRYEDAMREKNRLSLSVQPGNPLLDEVEANINNTRVGIKDYIAGYKRNALSERAGIQRKVNEVEGRISQIPTYEREFINIKRQQGIKENLYNFLLQRKEEASVSYASNIVDNKIISPAYIPNVPVKPKKTMIFLLFTAAGLILATVYIRLKYMLNNTLTSKKDIERITGIPVIAEIYKYDVPKKVVLNERSVLTEQVLNLRNNLRFLLAGVNHTPAILFTSSISGEGKTFISSHLGNALTYNNKRAVLLELDLRKPKLATSLGINNSSGITNYLVGVETYEQVVKKVPGNNNLDIIPSGPIPPNPIELIEGEKMRQLFALLRERYDYIIVDTSPIGMVSDAKSLSPYIDASLFVTRFNYTPKVKFKEIAADIDKAVFKKVGIVFNGVDLESSYGYYSYGYSDYGYGYGMENNTKKNFLVRFFRGLKQRVI